MVKMTTKNDLCSGCLACELVCALNKLLENNPTKAALKVEGKFPKPGKYYVNYCKQCGNCAEACPTLALYKDGVVFKLRKDLCTSCYLCVDACPKQVLFVDKDTKLPLKCDWCRDCSVVCAHGAITFVEEA
ncbi:MAG: putative ferredoxin-like protein YdhX [candidate division WS2 bacterium]|nr:putative ferredoxin-like protein YdhX [Candidatus Lithacetigena glycinireducens]